MRLNSASQANEKKLEVLFRDTNIEMQTCIQNCLECARVCEHLVQHCLKKGGKHSDPQHIKLLQDCVEICTLSAKFMLRQSEFHYHTCAICAETCKACAKDCESMDEDEMMKVCAEVCRSCAESCEKMSAMH